MQDELVVRGKRSDYCTKRKRFCCFARPQEYSERQVYRTVIGYCKGVLHTHVHVRLYFTVSSILSQQPDQYTALVTAASP